jgi:hypothetical protein
VKSNLISPFGDYVKKRVQDLTKGKQNPNLRGVVNAWLEGGQGSAEMRSKDSKKKNNR